MFKQTLFFFMCVGMFGCATMTYTSEYYCATNAEPLNEQEEKIYQSVEQCTELFAQKPTIVHAPGEPCQETKIRGCLKNYSRGHNIEGAYFMSCKKVIVPNHLWHVDVLRHEFIHHLLDENGREQESSDHTAPEFDRCEEEPNSWESIF